MDHFDKDIVIVSRQRQDRASRQILVNIVPYIIDSHNRRKNAQVLTNIDLGVTVRRALRSTGSLTCPVVHVHGISRDLPELIRLASRLMAYINAISEMEMKNAENTPFVQGLPSRSRLIPFSRFNYPAYVI
jgi:hypothetical protein